jgi:hypothetical protein
MAAQSTPPSDTGVGFAMVTFLAILFGIMLLLHFLQPEGQETKTSSPAHRQDGK